MSSNRMGLNMNRNNAYGNTLCILFIIEDLNCHSKSLSFLFFSSFLNSSCTTFALHVWDFGTVGLGQTESADSRTDTTENQSEDPRLHRD